MRKQRPKGFWRPGGEGYAIVARYVRREIDRPAAIKALKDAGCTVTMGRTDDESIGKYLLDWYAREVRKALGLPPGREPVIRRPQPVTLVERAVISDGGRLVIPAPFRQALGVNEGDEVIVHLEEEGLRILTPDQALRRAQMLLRRHVPAGRSLADELIAERREEAGRE